MKNGSTEPFSFGGKIDMAETVRYATLVFTTVTNHTHEHTFELRPAQPDETVQSIVEEQKLIVLETLNKFGFITLDKPSLIANDKTSLRLSEVESITAIYHTKPNIGRAIV